MGDFDDLPGQSWREERQLVHSKLDRLETIAESTDKTLETISDRQNKMHTENQVRADTSSKRMTLYLIIIAAVSALVEVGSHLASYLAHH